MKGHEVLYTEKLSAMRPVNISNIYAADHANSLNTFLVIIP